MNESIYPQPFYKKKQWIITIAIIVLVIFGAMIAMLMKQAADAESRADAKTAAAEYEKAAPADFNKLYALVSADAVPTNDDLTKVQKAANDRPRLADVKGVGADVPEYKKAKEHDQKINAFYATTISTLKKDLLPFVQYSAAIQNFATARDQAATAINASGGSAAAAVGAIRTKSIPIIQASLDSFKKVTAPEGSEKLTALVVKTHEDFMSGLESFAKEIESGGAIQNRDFGPQIAQINSDLQTLSETIQKKNDSLKSQGAAIQKQLGQ